ncbi:sensor histidine kinase [Antrihabitans stalactiti]|uniref:histidine kinase n=1 Tax=Antrihabitans stalactiti TaxID=2584121 RepID=A0A848KBL2_9NOCA|nr:ATP-binding protein [Antrihabitans stalactiti]NMN95086.1 hypothetical protein [Antrihabitans stalactiti]
MVVGVLVASFIPVLAVLPFGFARHAFLTDYGWPWPTLIHGVVIGVAPLVLSLRWFVAYLVAYGPLVAMATWWAGTGWSAYQVAVNTVSTPLFGLVVAGATIMSTRAAATLDRDTGAALVQAARRAATIAMATERARVDGLVHDAVLAALLFVGRTRGNVAAIAVAGGQGIAALDRITAEFDPAAMITVGELVVQVRRTCAEIDHRVVVSLAGDPQRTLAASAAQLFLEVASEAVRNSVRHADRSDRAVNRVVEVREADLITVRITDDGSGFEPTNVGPTRMGLAVASARVDQYGGASLLVDSSPGAGTVIEVAAPSIPVVDGGPRTAIGDAAQHTEPVTAAGMVGLHTPLAAVLLTTYLAVEAARGFESHLDPRWFSATLAVLLAGIVLLVAPSLDPMPQRRAVVLAVVPGLAALANVTAINSDSHHGHNALWSWTMGTLLMALLTLRGRFMLAWCGMLAATAVFVGWAAHSRTGFYGDFTGMVTWEMMLLAITSAFSVTMWRMVGRINAVRIRSIALATERAESEARLRERDDQLRYLNVTARPMLVRMCQPERFEDDECLQALLLEARLRDRIRARTLASEPLLDAAARARSRGIDVVLLGDGDVEEDQFRELTEIAIRELDTSEGNQVTIRVHPDGRSKLCTIVHNGQNFNRRVEIPRSDALADA